jgi:hypothetical protein
MRKPLTLLLVSALGLLGVLAAGPSTAAAAEKTPITAPPFQGEQPLSGLVLYVDTVVSGKAAVTQKEPLPGCTETSLIHFGQTIVFRVWGVDVKKGGVAVTENNVEEGEAYITIPGVLVNGVSSTLRVPLVWGEHSQAKTPEGEKTKHSYWTVGVPTKGETSPLSGWKTESSPGVLSAELPEKTKIEIPATSPSPLAFVVHVKTKSEQVTKVIKKKVKRHGKKKVIKKKKKVTVPGRSGEFSQANFPLSSQLVIAA